MSSPASFTRSAPSPLWLAVTRAGGWGSERETEIHPVRVLLSTEQGFSGTREFWELLCTLPSCILLGHSCCGRQPYKLPLNPKLVLLPSLCLLYTILQINVAPLCRQMTPRCLTCDACWGWVSLNSSDCLLPSSSSPPSSHGVPFQPPSPQGLSLCLIPSLALLTQK